MGGSYSQWAAATQFFLYGRQYFTKSGYEVASQTFVRGELERVDCTRKNLVVDHLPSHSFAGKGRVFMVTGASSGIYMLYGLIHSSTMMNERYWQRTGHYARNQGQPHILLQSGKSTSGLFFAGRTCIYGCPVYLSWRGLNIVFNDFALCFCVTLLRMLEILF